MSVFLGLGSNLGNRTEHLEQAIVALSGHPDLELTQVSSTYESHAWLPPDASGDWDKPFGNLVAEIETGLDPQQLLRVTQEIERGLGRGEAPRWAPRVIDIDIVLHDDHIVESDQLQVPHAQASVRPFVLRPLAEIAPMLIFPGSTQTVLELLRGLDEPLPAWMAVMNITPDSFADDDQRFDLETLNDGMVPAANYLDIGAESTRPGAETIDPATEWQRLSPVLERLHAIMGHRRVKPKISVDTRNVATAALALEHGADLINDVTGLADPAMVELLACAGCDVVIMHSLVVPADPSVTLPPDADPVRTVLEWCDAKLESLAARGVPPERIIVDPGLGFGKSARQSLEIIRRADELTTLPCRVLIGHSRKSYLTTVTQRPAHQRDIETLAVSGRLIDKGVDILRVHNVDAHRRFWRALSKI